MKKNEVGMKFIKTSSSRWGGAGRSGEHTFRCVNEITKVENGLVSYKLVEVLEEHGAPPAAIRRDPGGSDERSALQDRRS
jgi:hypothetical protein